MHQVLCFSVKQSLLLFCFELPVWGPIPLPGFIPHPGIQDSSSSQWPLHTHTLRKPLSCSLQQVLKFPQDPPPVNTTTTNQDPRGFFLVTTYFVASVCLVPCLGVRSGAVSFPSMEGGGSHFRGAMAQTCLDLPWLPTWDSMNTKALDFSGRRKEGRDRFRAFKGALFVQSNITPPS